VVSSSLPAAVSAAFVMLTVALGLLWVPVSLPLPLPLLGAARIWIVPAAIALISAFIGGLIDARGAIALLAFAAACAAANRGGGRFPNIVAHAIMLAIGAGLFLHALPGIDNPRVVTDAVLGPGAMPYSKYLNFDKGIAGLCLLGLYAPDLTACDEGWRWRHMRGFLWRFASITIIVMGLSLAAGFVRWDPKLPSWWMLWAWSMIALTALPEEAVFRGLAQTWIARGLASQPHANVIAFIVAGLLFGIAHAAGGPVYVLLASVAGIGYGWVFASTRSIGAAIATHVGVNAIHFFLFTYPALVRG
jgi:uncharacterized protein